MDEPQEKIIIRRRIRIISYHQDEKRNKEL